MGVALIIIILICAFWPAIVRLLQRFMARRAEDMVRRMAGMPSRKEEKRRRRQQQEQQRQNGSRRQGSPGNPGDGVRAMKEYAEDVAFTEIREFSSDEVIAEEGTGKNRRVYREEQVSDAEYVEIKTSSRK